MNPLTTVVRTPGVLYLLATSLLGRLPSAMAALALVHVVRAHGGDYALAGITTASFIGASAIGLPLLSRWIDRARQSHVLMIAGLVSSLAFIAVALLAPISAIGTLVAAVIAGAFTPPLEPSLRSLWPRLVPEERPLRAAYSLDAGAQEIVFILGPILTVFGIAAFGASGNILFAGALGLLGALAFALHPISRRTVAVAVAHGVRRSPLRSAGLRRLVIFAFGAGVPVGALTIVVTRWSEDRGLADLAGWALSANAIGALLGAVTLAAFPFRRPATQMLALCGLVLALGFLPLMIADLSLPLLLLVALISGIAFPPALAQIFDTVQSVVPAETLTEANAWTVSAVSVGIATGTLGAGLAAHLPVNTATVLIIGIAAALTALLSLAVLPRRMRALSQ